MEIELLVCVCGWAEGWPGMFSKASLSARAPSLSSPWKKLCQDLSCLVWLQFGSIDSELGLSETHLQIPSASELKVKYPLENRAVPLCPPVLLSLEGLMPEDLDTGLVSC